MPVVYKTFTQTDLDNKATYAASTNQKEKASTVISKFVTLFKAKHLG